MGTSALVEAVSAVWDAGLAGKVLTLVTGWNLAAMGATSVPDLNLVFNVAMFVLVAAVARPLMKSKVKDGTIKDLRESNEAKTGRIEELTSQVRNIEAAAAHCATEATDAKARYEEVLKFTAQPAVEHFEALLVEHSAKVAERHAMMLDALERMTSTLAVIEQRMNGGQRPTA